MVESREPMENLESFLSIYVAHVIEVVYESLLLYSTCTDMSTHAQANTHTHRHH